MVLAMHYAAIATPVSYATGQVEAAQLLLDVARGLWTLITNFANGRAFIFGRRARKERNFEKELKKGMLPRWRQDTEKYGGYSGGLDMTL